MLKKVFDFLSYWYFQYTLVTALYMMEPIERWVFNAVLVAILAMGIYTAFLFLPGHTIMLMDFFEYLLGIDQSQSEYVATEA